MICYKAADTRRSHGLSVIALGRHMLTQMLSSVFMVYVILSLLSHDVSASVIRRRRTVDLPWLNPCAGSSSGSTIPNLDFTAVEGIETDESEQYQDIAEHAEHLEGIVISVKNKVAGRIQHEETIAQLDGAGMTLEGLPNFQSLSVDLVLESPGNLFEHRSNIVHRSYEYLATVAVYLEYARQVEQEHTTHSGESLDEDLHAVEARSYTIMCFMHGVIADMGDSIMTSVTRDTIHEMDKTNISDYKDMRAYLLLKQFSGLLRNLKLDFLYLKQLTDASS